MKIGTLYLIPNLLGEGPTDQVLPAYNREVIMGLRYFLVEEIRTARRFLKKVDRSIDIDQLHFDVLNEHSSRQELEACMQALYEGNDVGIISEAGCPAVADPGADAVALAQAHGGKVVPLVGPSSILLALMGSGFNGQRFCFQGYLPVDSNERAKAIRKMENRIYSEHETQLFIETPYRNQKLLDALCATCKPTTKLCIACNLTMPDALLQTRPLSYWKQNPPTEWSKRPAIFLLYQ